MAEKQLEILRGYELRLLRCTLAPPPSDLRIQSQPLNEESQCSILPLHEHINSLINSIESGHYLQALSSDEAKHALDTLDFVDINDSAECADRVYSELLQLVKASIVNDSEIDVDKACRNALFLVWIPNALFHVWIPNALFHKAELVEKLADEVNMSLNLFSDSGWDMAPYIETIDSQQSSCFILKFFCDLLRIRWESTRSRTKGRALEMMDKLVEGICNSSPGVTQSIPFCYVICVPTIPALRNLLGKKAAAVELIKARLSEKPNDPTLWDDFALDVRILQKKMKDLLNFYLVLAVGRSVKRSLFRSTDCLFGLAFEVPSGF
ncbi:hypothetical protein CUMW_245430 [Citrus unshiu]|nr:hypothetical protein CUMW_245430 [Citrus unshiu]